MSPRADRWTTRDLPVLEKIDELLEAAPLGGMVQVNEVIAALPELAEDDVYRAVKALDENGFLKGVSAMGAHTLITFFGVTPEGLRAIHAWPSPQAAETRLIAALDALIAKSTGDDRTRLEKIRDGFIAAGTTVTTSLVTSVLTGQIPGAS